MNNAAQIPRCSGSLHAKHFRLQPPFLSPAPARRPDPKISNRESSRLDIHLNHSNRGNNPRFHITAPSTCRGGPSVPFADAPPGFRPSVRPFSLAPPPARHPNLEISNRESLRRVRADDSARRNDDVINVTQTKQKTQPHSNREVEALFSNHKRPASHLNLNNSNRESLRLEIDLT
jgi:hypothetical protein